MTGQEIRIVIHVMTELGDIAAMSVVGNMIFVTRDIIIFFKIDPNFKLSQLRRTDKMSFLLTLFNTDFTVQFIHCRFQ